MLAMGMLKESQQELGLECSGVVTRVGSSQKHDLKAGDKACALSMHGHFANHVRVPATSAVRIPKSMSFETAASMTMTFATAFYSLFWAGRAEDNETVLIHAAAGGVGQACLSLAQLRGLDIYVTVGSQEKRDFLIDKYGISPGRIFSSRDPSFAKKIWAATDYTGVDIIINSLAGKLLDVGWNLLAPHGRFVEIGKRDIHENKSLDMESFQRGLSFIHVDLIQLADDKPAIIHRILQRLVSLMSQKLIKPVSPINTFSISEIGRAFRLMQSSTHTGKIVIVP